MQAEPNHVQTEPRFVLRYHPAVMADRIDPPGPPMRRRVPWIGIVFLISLFIGMMAAAIWMGVPIEEMFALTGPAFLAVTWCYWVAGVSNYIPKGLGDVFRFGLVVACGTAVHHLYTTTGGLREAMFALTGYSAGLLANPLLAVPFAVGTGVGLWGTRNWWRRVPSTQQREEP